MIYLMVWMTGYVCYENDLPYIDYYFTMIIAFQLAVFALIATSSILLISVPVVFASSDMLKRIC